MTNTATPQSNETKIGIQCFPGIRYAEPPVGALRFAPPRAAGFDTKAAAASTAGPISPQSPSRLSNVMGDFTRTQSEDCLNLTVWTPARDTRSRPVLFWIHGGAFMSGAGALDWYDGSLLCQEGDVVVVSPNYRLGALGFLCHPGLSSGNLGLLDLELALQWTRDNIRQFGGDPDRITVMGQSAGAWSAALMVARMPANAPTIHQIILQSGPLGIPPTPVDKATIMAEHFLQALTGKQADKGALEQARQALVPDILAAQGAAIRAVGMSLTKPGHPPVPYGPVWNDIEIPLNVDYAAYLAKAAARVPVMVGWTGDEMSAFNPAQPGSPEATANARTAHDIFDNPSMQWAANARQAGRPAYVYRFDWAPEGSPFGACHCIELPFVFGSFSAFKGAPMLGTGPLATLQALSGQVRASWLAFAKHGDPNATQGRGLPAWPVFEAATRPVMHIDINSTVEAAP